MSTTRPHSPGTPEAFIGNLLKPLLETLGVFDGAYHLEATPNSITVRRYKRNSAGAYYFDGHEDGAPCIQGHCITHMERPPELAHEVFQFGPGGEV